MNNHYENEEAEVDDESSVNFCLNGELIEKLQKIKSDFYVANRKKTFFTSGQKAACAESVCAEIDINKLMAYTIYIIKNTNIIFFNYLVFKTYANQSNFSIINEFIFDKINTCVQQYGSFEMHFDLVTFTVTAAERYKHLIELFVAKCLERRTGFIDLTINITIYNTPSMVEHIHRVFKMLIHPSLKTKIIYRNKEESPDLLKKLLQS